MAALPARHSSASTCGAALARCSRAYASTPTRSRRERCPARRGSAGSGHNGRTQISWDLTGNASGTPLFTFPRWAWEREALPGAQIVPVPSALFHGTVRHGGRVIPLAGAPGATARVYGHGNAQLWAWLHADLG